MWEGLGLFLKSLSHLYRLLLFQEGEGVVIAQELVHSIDNKKGKKRFMAIKVDLAKAFDCLEWNFIHKVLKAFHFPNGLLGLIMSCISSSNISILFNGGKLDKFKPTRGIHQGDPLSLYIFLLCMEFLGFLIDKECLEKNWVPMKASRTNVEISHLFSWTILCSLPRSIRGVLHPSKGCLINSVLSRGKPLVWTNLASISPPTPQITSRTTFMRLGHTSHLMP